MKKQEKFQEMRGRMLEQGYKEKNVTFSSGKIMATGLIAALPIVIILGMIYRFFLIDRAHLTDVGGLNFYIVLIIIIAVTTVIHELLHGIGWALAGGKGWSVIKFNIHALMPSCACVTVLKKGQYLTGTLLPIVVLGTGSILFIFVYPGTISILVMAANFVGAGADIIIAAHVIMEEADFIIDHPRQAGYIAFVR